MKKVIFTRNPYKVTPLNDWVGDCGDQIIVITKKDFKDEYIGFYKVCGLDDYESDDCKLKCIQNIHDEFEISHIAALSEYDLVAAAKLRKTIGIIGQSISSAIAFRNKYVMKTHVASVGSPVPAFSRVDSKLDIEQFVQKNGFPIVIKPIDGAGSINTIILNSNEELEKIVDLDSTLLAETFVSNEMIHVDGFYFEGKIKFITASKYFGNCLSHQTGDNLGSYQLEEGSALFKKAEVFLSRVIGALPCPNVMCFHAEFFVKDEELVFCEIASRLGGARIIETLEYRHGFSFAKEWLRSQLGIEFKLNFSNSSSYLYGWGIIPPKEGIIQQIPSTKDLSWCIDVIENYKIGDRIYNAKSSVDSLVSFIVKAETEKDLIDYLSQVFEYYNNNLVID